MATFAGVYVKEPADFATELTERDLIDLLDDPGGEASLADRWANLTALEIADFVAIANPVIRAWEGVVNGRAYALGYALPLDVTSDPAITKAIAAAAVLDLKKRRGMLTQGEYDDAMAAWNKAMVLIFEGGLLSPMGEAGGPLVEGYSSAEPVFSRYSLLDW